MTIARMVFDDNHRVVISNLERIFWSLDNTMYLIRDNANLIEEFEYLFDYDNKYDNFDDKIIESKSLIGYQHFILIMSYYEYYLYFLDALLSRRNIEDGFSKILEELLKSRSKIDIKKLSKKIGIEKKDVHFINYHSEILELRNALVHRNKKITKDSIIILKNYINDKNEVHLDYSKTIKLLNEVNDFVDEIDKKVLLAFPKLNLL